MAELRDTLNRKVLHVELEKQEAEKIFTNVKLVFQKQIFVDNNVGWIDEVQAELCWYKLKIVRSELVGFIDAAKCWSALSLSELAKTFFTGHWSLGSDFSTERFDIQFKPLSHTPTKTDGFTVCVDICFGNLWKTQEFSSDYTSLVNFIQDLSASLSFENV
jgi:hypothetical protein